MQEHQIFVLWKQGGAPCLLCHEELTARINQNRVRVILYGITAFSVTHINLIPTEMFHVEEILVW